MVVEFEDKLHGDAHDSFQDWRRNNPHGFLINLARKPMIHAAACMNHLGDMQWSATDLGQSLTRNRKVCATTITELRDWASKAGLQLVDCGHCHPASKAHDYSHLATELSLDLATPRPSTPAPLANDFQEAPDRVVVQVYRILRDTELAREVKRLHNYQCQVCGETIILPNGCRYAEAHHIQPLGRDHNGPDALGNILCVCPNHHAELDYGVRRISLDALRRVTAHDVDERFVQYHNKLVEQHAKGS